MSGMKYIFFRGVQFVIFPASFTHDEMAEKFFPMKPTSAGFCEITSEKNEFGEMRYNVRTFGKSLSLGLDSIEEHGKIMGIALSEK